MEKRTKQKVSWPLVLGISTTILAALLVALVLPRTQHRLSVSVVVGEVWNKDDVQAPFDFTLLKTEDQQREEREAIEKAFKPHYRMVEDADKRDIRAFAEGFDRWWRTLDSLPQALEEKPKGDWLNQSARMLRDVHKQGVVAKRPTAGRVVLMDGQTGRTVSADQLLTVQQATDQLASAFPTAVQGQVEQIFSSSVRPSYVYDDSLNQAVLERDLAQLTTTAGLVREGELIVSNGQVVTEDIQQALLSLQRVQKSRQTEGRPFLQGLSNGLICLLWFGVLGTYLYYFDRSLFMHTRRYFFVLMLGAALVILTAFIERTRATWMYAIPFPIFVVLLIPFFKRETTVVLYAGITSLAAWISSGGLPLFFWSFAAGVWVAVLLRNARYWGDFFKASLVVFSTYFLFTLGLALQSGMLLDVIWLRRLGFLALNAFFVLMAYPLIPIFERLTGLLSPMTLIEWADPSKPLLKRLSLEAPGTFQHSLQVANLAEAAAAEIGADPLLVKTAAMYHDVGKLKAPAYFIENQYPGENPHDGLAPEESARIITEHVTEGVRLAKKAGLPSALIDFIKTHHGTGTVRYFLHKAKTLNPDADAALFSYPGPKPQSREMAVLMMADSVEAASRSLQKPDTSSIEQLVDGIVTYQVSNQQFTECEITFQDVEKCKQTLKKLLAGIYHVRVEYPDGK